MDVDMDVDPRSLYVPSNFAGSLQPTCWSSTDVEKQAARAVATTKAKPKKKAVQAKPEEARKQYELKVP